MTNDQQNNEEETTLYIMGFHLGHHGYFESIYTFTLVSDTDRPLMLGDKIIFFSTLELATTALNLVTSDYKAPPCDVSLVCDIPLMIKLIKTENIDNDSTILNCLNSFFDLLNALSINLIYDYKKVLFNFADHLTFHSEFSSFLHDNNIQRQELIEAVLWCLKHIFYGSSLLTPEGLIDMSTLTFQLAPTGVEE